MSAALLVAALLVVAGCTAIEPGIESTPTPGVTEVVDTPIPAEPAAVVTIAEIEVDGSGVIVGGLITGSEVSGGLCTYVLAPAVGEPVSIETGGLPNVGSTSCGSPFIPMASLGRGSWTVTLKFVAGDATLESEPVDLEIP